MPNQNWKYPLLLWCAMVLFKLTVSGVARVAAFNPRPALRRLPPNLVRRPASSAVEDVAKPPLPMTLLAGFLGSGKTTTLKHLLENTKGIRIGVVVNDVASVNIDAKLVAGESNGDMVMLQNGCACCSIADELITTVERLCLTRELDAVVVELSGLADPKAIQNNWKMAPSRIKRIANIERVVTLVDAQTFGSDFMTWDMVQNRDGWADPNDPCGGNMKVSELLAEQVETADLILVNKADLATDDEVRVASKVAAALNEKAVLEKVTFGQTSPALVLGLSMLSNTSCADPECTNSTHDHSHAIPHSEDDLAPKDSATAECSDPHCTDTSHEHSHSHADATACNDPHCTDTSHEHSHSHADATACNDPHCTDTSHEHSHSHSTSTDSLGISNFVYKAQRPFHSQRLMMLLNRWPVPKKDVLDLDFLENIQAGGNVDVFGKSLDDNPFLGVLRTKGFTWLSPTQWSGIMEDAWRHDTAMYMSHAGRHMSIDTAGRWWATVPADQMEKFFEGDLVTEKERILREDFVSEEFGDRRQELVFIGMDINKTAITEALDSCLLTDEEMETYRQNLNNYMQRSLSETASTTGLMDTTGTQHVDQ